MYKHVQCLVQEHTHAPFRSHCVSCLCVGVREALQGHVPNAGSVTTRSSTSDGLCEVALRFGNSLIVA